MIPTGLDIPAGQGLEQQLLLMLLQMLTQKPQQDEEELKRLGGGDGTVLQQFAGNNSPDSSGKTGNPGGGPAPGGDVGGTDLLDFIYQLQRRAAIKAASGGFNRGSTPHVARPVGGL